jgi:hypothetical protein
MPARWVSKTYAPVLAEGKTSTGRIRVRVGGDRPFSGAGPPAAALLYPPDRRAEQPSRHLDGHAGLLQADASSGPEAWMREQRARLPRHTGVARAMDHMLRRRPAFARFVDDGRICPSNNAAERSVTPQSGCWAPGMADIHRLGPTLA